MKLFMKRVWWGNPMFSSLARHWFKVRVNDVNCGLRGFTKEFYTGLRQRCIGMEFATEMIIKGSLYGARIAEVPITLSPDGRVAHPAHLRTFRDGWRTLRFYLLYSPRWLFLIPGLALIVLGWTRHFFACAPISGSKQWMCWFEVALRSRSANLMGSDYPLRTGNTMSRWPSTFFIMRPTPKH